MIDFAYISIPKTASQSIRQLFINNNRIDLATKNHESIYNYNEDVSFSFSFVREPIQRLKSWFYFCKTQMYDTYKRNYDLFSIYDCSFAEWISKDFPIHWSDEMCQKLGITSPLIQCDFVCRNGIIDIDYLADFNNIENEMIFLINKMNFKDKNLPIIAKYDKPNEDLKDNHISIIKQKFANDFKLYQAVLENKHLTKGTKVF